MKENDFVCPYCRGQLKPHNKVILSGRNENGKRGLLLFNPQLGQYDILHHNSFSLNEGEHLDILCPLCHANLTDQTLDRNLARVKMIDTNGKEFDIYFSEIVGLKCTYKISGDKKEVESFGEDADEYRNYWGESPRY